MSIKDSKMSVWVAIAINIVVYLVSFAYAWGKLNTKISEIEKRYYELDDKVTAITDCSVQKEQYKSEQQNINRRIDELTSLDIDARLTKIETLLETILGEIKNGKYIK